MSPADRIMILHRINAPADTVRAMWTAPQHLARWWPVRGQSFIVAETTPDAGGRFYVATRNPDLSIEQESGRFAVAGGDGPTVIALDSGRTLTLQFRRVPGGTNLTLSEGPLADERVIAGRTADWDARLAAIDALCAPAGVRR